jgi:flagellar biosynthesis protein FlhG
MPVSPTDSSRSESPRRGAIEAALDSERRPREPSAPIARVVCVASGKGGTGKSVVATNLALLRAARGERVLLIDLAAGFANDHLLLGLSPELDLVDVVDGRASPADAIVEGPGGVRLLSGGVGRHALAHPLRSELARLFRALRPLEDEFDRIVIDHGAGLSYATLAHLAAASALLIVATHEVTALSDAYALFKRARMVNRGIHAGLVLNRVPSAESGDAAWERLSSACGRFLGCAPERVGDVPADPSVPRSVEARTPVAVLEPASSAAGALDRVAGWNGFERPFSGMAFYDRALAALQ